MKNDFKSFPVGTVFNPLPTKKVNTQLVNPASQVTVEFPSRLNAMAIDPSKIATNENMVFTPGEVVFAVDITKKVTVTLDENSTDITINEDAKRRSLIMHATLLMKKALNFDQGLHIHVENKNELKHCGLGSSSSLIASTAATINEFFGKPITNKDLLKYIAQNHGEEIDDDDNALMPVQCIGGSASSGLYEGSVIILTGENTVIIDEKVEGKDVLIGVPNDFVPRDSEELLGEEIKNFDKFIQTGATYGKEIAYNILHKGIPSLRNNDLAPLGDIIFKYRFDMGSIENCSFVFPRINVIAENLRTHNDALKPDVLALSSVGPAFFVICDPKQTNEWKQIFEDENMKVIPTQLYNTTYKVLEKK